MLVVCGQQCRIKLRVAHIDALLAGKHLQKARGIPDFCSKITTQLKLLFGDVDILPSRRQGNQTEAQSIGAEVLDDIERIDGIAQALAHLAPLVVAHGAVEIHPLEGHIAHEFQAGHNHARNPEEDNVRGGD